MRPRPEMPSCPWRRSQMDDSTVWLPRLYQSSPCGNICCRMICWPTAQGMGRTANNMSKNARSMTANFADVVGALNYRDIPKEATDIAKRVIVDALACTIGGFD